MLFIGHPYLLYGVAVGSIAESCGFSSSKRRFLFLDGVVASSLKLQDRDPTAATSLVKWNITSLCSAIKSI
jgi:hypothetical protein